MKKNIKFSDTSLRVIETLKMLVQKKSSIQDIINHFEKIDPQNRIYTSEVILKYINTLKVFGFKFIKEKDKYVLLNPPNHFKFDLKDLHAIKTIETLSENIHESVVKNQIDSFLQEIKKRLDSESLKLLQQQNIMDSKITKKTSEEEKILVSKIEKYCLEQQKIKLSYINAEDTEQTIMAEPKEIKYHNKSIYFSIYNPIEGSLQDIELSKIIQLSQLPIRSNPNKLLSTSAFKLKGRLAKAYKLHEEEKILEFCEDGSIVVLSTNEDRNMLLKRLMRYSENCEIISPKTLRKEMARLITETIKNYG